MTRLKNTVFDFNRFLTEFSNILYELFIWHLYFQNADPIRFSQFEFDHYLNLTTSRSYPLVYDNGGRALDELRVRVERKLKFFGRKYPHANLEVVRQKYLQLGLTSDNVYLFVRGHNLYNLILLICKEVCKAVLRREKRNRMATREMLNELYRYRYSLEEQLKQNIKYGAYLPIRKIEEDIRQLLGEN